MDICMVLSSLYEFSTRRFAAPAESGGEASAFISLDVKKARIFSPFGEKTASSALRPNPRGLFCAKRTTIFCRRWDFAHGRRKRGVCAAFIHLVKKKPRSGAESRPFVD
ncbi:MAG: hypothetical protein U0K13_08885 [Oscillospiraceae bacterium]|nr:hypothetical protein [Oscillospiraceae bacterium]